MPQYDKVFKISRLVASILENMSVLRLKPLNLYLNHISETVAYNNKAILFYVHTHQNLLYFFK